MLQEVREHHVLECKFFHTMEGSAGFAVMTNCYQFFVVPDTSRPRDEIRVKKVADLPCKFKSLLLLKIKLDTYHCGALCTYICHITSIATTGEQ